ncbi:pilus assembly PilX family protein [Sulfuricystis multivorans]|uniref:pilus assembly PilX family protein n=1 Tax=Sulfuricystis multivorans TaxID=2211108 RepID=UPI000F83EFCB|nr:hypothetical protein [Sulfuricystis multivorans]
MILFLALIVLVAMLLSGIALFRTVDSGILTAGNLALQKSAVSQGDRGIEDASSWLVSASAVMLNEDPAEPGYVNTPFYVANALDPNPTPPYHQPSSSQSWLTWWNAYAATNTPAVLASDPNTGLQVSYLIQRLCTANGAANAAGVYCAKTWDVSRLLPGSKRNDAVAFSGSAPAGVYYRIITRIDGPRNTTAFVEAIVSL